MTSAQRSCAASERSLRRRCGGSASSTFRATPTSSRCGCRGAKRHTTRSPDTVSSFVTELRGGLVVGDGADLGLEGWIRISIGAPAQMAILLTVRADHQEAYR